MSIIKDLIYYHGIHKDYFCDTQHFRIITRIMNDNIILGHIHILEISYKFLEHLY